MTTLIAAILNAIMQNRIARNTQTRLMSHKSHAEAAAAAVAASARAATWQGQESCSRTYHTRLFCHLLLLVTLHFFKASVTQDTSPHHHGI
jgi:hypothetical protein